jgi:hypothetical protein
MGIFIHANRATINYCKKTAIKRPRLFLMCTVFAFCFLANNAYAQCITGGLFPTATFTATCTGSAETVTTSGFAGEYSNINVTSGITYTFSSSVPTDFITLANGTTPFTWGTTPLTWTANASGIIRFYNHTNSSCGTQNTNRTRAVLCSPCITPAGLSASNITTTGATITWGLPAGSPTGYQWEVRTSGAAGSGNTGLAASGNASPSFVLGANVSGLSAGTSYSVYVRTDCGSGSFSAWSTAYTLNTLCPMPTSLSASSITASSAAINWVAPSGVTPAGYQWEVRSSGAGGSGAAGLTASGSTTSAVTANATGLTSGSSYSIYVRTTCGSGSSSWAGPATFSTILSCYPPTGLGASNITSSSATISWLAPTSGSPAGYDWELRTSGAGGSGSTGLFTNGSAVAPTVSVNITTLIQGTTYSLYVKTNCTASNGVSSWAGPYTFNVPPVNDLCSAAIALTCNSTVTGTTLGATNDGITDQCGASDVSSQAQTSPGVWFTLAGADQLVTISLCGSSYDSRISIMEGSCGSFTCVTGNDDYCNTQSQVSFSAYSGHTYYVLVHGYGTNSGAFSLATTCASLCTPASGNDNCSSPTTISISSPSSTAYTLDNNTCATAGPLSNPSNCGSAFASFVDVFYAFNSGSNTQLYLDLSNVGVSAPAASGIYYYALYTGTCPSPTYISCGILTVNTIATLTNLSASTNYLLRVYYVAGSGVAGNYGIMLKAPYLWTGAVDTDWMGTGNWQTGTVPNSSSDNVVIQNVTNKPLITVSANISVKDITINTGASLTINGNLKIAGTLAVPATGPIITNGGTVEFNGTTAQTIPAAAFSSNTINSLTVNNAAGVTLAGTLGITGTLTLTTGTLTTGGFLSLFSNASGTARIAAITGGSISGTVTQQRYVPAKSARTWSLVASPFTQIISSAWQQQVHITGAGTGGSICPSLTAHTNGFDATATNAASMYVYDGTKAVGSRWTSVASTNAVSLSVGMGYRMNIRGPRAIGCSLLNGTVATTTAATLSSTGTLSNANKNMGSFAITLLNNGVTSIANDNYLLTGNPYPSQISFSALQAANSSAISNTYAIYAPGNTVGNYAFWNGTTFTGGNTGVSDATGDIIANGQAFFVKGAVAGANITLNWTEAMKTASANNGYFRQLNPNRLRIGYMLADGSKADEIMVQFSNNGTQMQLNNEDVVSINTGTQYIKSMKAGNGLAFNTRNINFISDTVHLNVVSSSNGAFKLSFYDFEQFVSGTNAKIHLVDNYTGVTQLMNDNKEYPFTINTADAATQGTDRFSVVFSKSALPPIVLTTAIKVYPNPVSSLLTVQLPATNNDYTIRLLDMNGKLVLNQKTKLTVTLNIDRLSNGIYMLEITNGNGEKTIQKIIKQ